MAANGGWVTADDLARLPPPREQPAVHGQYRDWDVYTLLPPGVGLGRDADSESPPVVRVRGARPGAANRPDLVIEALAIGHTSSRKNPVHDMANPTAEIAERTSSETAPVADCRARAKFRRDHALLAGRWRRDGDRGDRQHQRLFRRAGRQPETGVFLQRLPHRHDRGRRLAPFCAARRRAALFFDGRHDVSRATAPHFAAGSPGSARIISTVSQVVQLWADGHRDIAGAVSEPRWHVIPPERLYAEDLKGAAAWRERIEKRGWTVRGAPADMEPLGLRGRNAYFGGVHAVALENGRWTGAADPRRDGWC